MFWSHKEHLERELQEERAARASEHRIQEVGC